MRQLMSRAHKPTGGKIVLSDKQPLDRGGYADLDSGARKKKREIRKRPELHDNQVNLEPDFERVAISPCAPIAAEKRASFELAHILDRLNLQSALLNSLPPYVGGLDTRVDAAAHAVIAAYQHVFRPTSTSEVLFIKRNHEAIGLLRAKIDVCDTSLATVILLSLANSLSNGNPWDTRNTHVQGMNAILGSRPQGEKLNDFARSTVRTCTATNFIAYCTSGKPSPWDHERWLGQDMNYSVQNSTSEFAKLKDASFRLLVKLPGLIKLVREYRQCSMKQTCDNRITRITVATAKQLLSVEDRLAEDAMLHRLRVVPTEDTSKAAIMKYSYSIGTFGDTDTALFYWTLRLMLIRLCLQLNGHNVFDEARLLAEAERLAVNVIMVLPGHFEGHLYPPGQALALVILWGALSDQEYLRNTPTSVISRWVWRKLETLLPLSAERINPGSLDTTADLFAGGPIAGLLVDNERQAA
ncbi:hypothetical protein LTR17_004578 [Elasticomyces elasticus]|nr:hypothetical protein LTR17_004578 [Elasticomyces elasticus]